MAAAVSETCFAASNGRQPHKGLAAIFGLEKMKKKWTELRFAILAMLLGFVMVASLSVGSAGIGIGKSLRIFLSHIPYVGAMTDISDVSAMQDYIIMQVRLPRLLLSVLVGAGLSGVGCVFQGLFQNPLADPHILGISSGAALGATIAILSGVTVSAAGLGTIGVFAFAGAAVTMVVVCLVSGAGRRGSVITVLLTGTAVSTMLSAVISLLMTMNKDGIEKVYMWTMGSFSSASWSKTVWMAGIGAASAFVLFLCAGDLNLMAMGEDTAQSLGVETGKVRGLILFFASLSVAVAVSVSGMISFVGLVVPHCMRFLFGGDYRKLYPASLLGGGLFLLLCDTAARTVMAPGEIPVGVVTAIEGSPYFIYLIRKNARK